MIIRRAQEKDIDRINTLLYQVNQVHADGRPDIFIGGQKKYNDEELKELLNIPERPIFVAVDDEDIVMGYSFCILEKTEGCSNMVDMLTLYIDDLCVDEVLRGKHIGKALYEYVLAYAKSIGCYRVTLNVWNCNEPAMKFYNSCGLKPLKITMEKILKDN